MSGDSAHHRDWLGTVINRDNAIAGCRRDVGKVDWDEVTAFVGETYCLVAPGRLAAPVCPLKLRNWY